MSLMKYTSGEGGKDDLENLVNFDYKRLPRFYRVLLLMKLVRLRHITKELNTFLKRFINN